MLLLLCPLSVLARPSLEVQLKKSSGELGRPVYLKIIGEELKTDLSKLSLHSLNKEFVLDSKDLDTEIVKQTNGDDKQKNKTSIRRQTLSLKLYPRQTGELLIPSFTIDKHHSTEKTIIILDAITDGKIISIDWKLMTSEAWQREQIVISLALTTPEEYATIKLAKQSVDGFEITPLPVNREWIEDDQGGKSTITAGWSLLPLKSGNMEIDLPAIEYHLSGVIRRNFYLPKIKLAIRPLATYLPPTIPVGKLNIESSITPTGILNTNDLAYWNISIESKSLTPYWLPPVLRQIKSNDNILFFPATSKRSMHPDSKGVHGRVNHTIPFKPLSNGLINLPALKIQYFDPITGRLESITHQTKRPISIGTATRILAIFIFLVVLLYLWKGLYRYIHSRVKYRKRRLNALEMIKQAKTKEEVLAGLRLLGRSEGWPANLTLSEWLECWQMKYLTEPQLKEAIQSLSNYCYGLAKENSLQAIISSLAKLLKKPQNI